MIYIKLQGVLTDKQRHDLILLGVYPFAALGSYWIISPANQLALEKVVDALNSLGLDDREYLTHNEFMEIALETCKG